MQNISGERAARERHPEPPLPYARDQGDYDPLELIELQSRLSDIALDLERPIPTVLHDLGMLMKDFFGTSYVEFLMVEGDCLVYKYINDMPPALDRLLERLKVGPGVIGLRIPLFEGSCFKKLIDGGVPREIMTYEDRLASFRDFIAPEGGRNRFLRERFAPVLMPLLGYDYIFQVPLVSGRKVIGFFSFLQKGRIRPRMRADLVLMSSQIAGFLSLRSEGERRQRLFDSLPNPTVRFTAGGKAGGAEGEARAFAASDVNPAFRSHFGAQAEREMLGAKAGELGKRVSIPDLEGIMAEVERSLVPKIIELGLKQSFLAATISRVDEGELIVTVEDISIRKKHEQELATAACYDPLTGLLNRRVFMEMLGREIAGMKREGGEGSLLFLDLNRFKDVNDSLGHEAGDRLLKHVAATLVSALRESDTMARFGGDEFLVFCRKAGRDKAPAIADKIASRLAASTLELGGSPMAVTASIGIASYPGSAPNAEGLVSAADQAMYQAKREGVAYRLAPAIKS